MRSVGSWRRRIQAGLAFIRHAGLLDHQGVEERLQNLDKERNRMVERYTQEFENMRGSVGRHDAVVGLLVWNEDWNRRFESIDRQIDVLRMQRSGGLCCDPGDGWNPAPKEKASATVRRVMTGAVAENAA